MTFDKEVKLLVIWIASTAVAGSLFIFFYEPAKSTKLILVLYFSWIFLL